MTGATLGEKSAERLAQRNGYRDRDCGRRAPARSNYAFRFGSLVSGVRSPTDPVLERRSGDHAMKRDVTKPAAGEAEDLLLDDWFDPI